MAVYLMTVTGWVKAFDQSRSRVPISRHKEMYDLGFRVMAGYAGGGSPDKWTPTVEIQSWLSQGSDTGFAALFEITGTEPIDAPSSGLAHAQSARAAWRARGYPDDCSIAPAMDENVTIPQARVQLTQYFTLWKTWDTKPPLPYVEMDAGAVLFDEGLTVGTFTPAAYSWDPSGILVTPSNAPSHVLWTQEKNSQDVAGGNVDIGHIRVTAPIMWAIRGDVMEAIDFWTWKPVPVWKGTADETAFGQLAEARNNAIAANAKAGTLQTEMVALVAKADAIATKVDLIPTTTVPTAPLSDADIERIAQKTADIISQRLES